MVCYVIYYLRMCSLMANGYIKEYTKYLLYSGVEKNEAALFTDVGEAEKQCYIMYETIKRDRREAT